MIEFNGEVSEKCKKYILHYNKKFSLLVLTIVSMIASIPIILFAVMWDGLCALFLLIFAVMLLYGLCYRAPKKDYSKYMPNTVVIDNYEIYSESAEFYYSRNLADIKAVIDYGEWYRILFYLPFRCDKFVCEKALITQGTIEEFESIFAGKIKRKYR